MLIKRGEKEDRKRRGGQSDVMWAGASENDTGDRVQRKCRTKVTDLKQLEKEAKKKRMIIRNK